MFFFFSKKMNFLIISAFRKNYKKQIIFPIVHIIGDIYLSIHLKNNLMRKTELFTTKKLKSISGKFFGNMMYPD